MHAIYVYTWCTAKMIRRIVFFTDRWYSGSSVCRPNIIVSFELSSKERMVKMTL